MRIKNEASGNTTSSDKDTADLLNSYIWLWERVANLPDEEFQTAFLDLKKRDSHSSKAKSWIIFTEGIRCAIRPQLGNSFEKLSEAVILFQQNEDRLGEGAALSLITITYKSNGQLDKAQQTAHKAIEYLEEYKPFFYFLQIAYFHAGEIHYLLKDYDSAIQLFKKGLTYTEEDETNMGARLLNGIGNVYNAQNNFELAFEYLQKSLTLVRDRGNALHESRVYADFGNYYLKKNDFENALNCQLKSIEIRQNNNLTNPLLTNYIELAEIYLKQKKLKEAFDYASLAEKKAIDLNIIMRRYEANLILSKIYEEMGEPKLALEEYKKYNQIKDEVLSQESTRKIKQLSMQHEIETMQKEKEIFKLRNVILKEALDEIGSSVRYAKRIQEAILPPINLIRFHLPNSYVLYKPKDVVAGDFYWMEEIDNIIFIAAADCTGHGVPGAMVSVVCCNALNRAVKEFNLKDTGKILDKVSDLVCETFERSNENVKDGMDISLLTINKSTNRIHWSGANNPLWYFYEEHFNEIKADKRPIGKSDNLNSFTTHTIDFLPNTTFILFTDGYADQFGGEKGKKLMYKQFKESIAATINKGMHEQRRVLEENFNNWKGTLEQVDDVCVIGIRL